MICIMADNKNHLNQQQPTDQKDIIHQHSAQTERLAGIGKFAAKIAHELNNPLDGILRYLNLAIRSIEKENLDKPTEYLVHCREGLMRMVQVIRELLEYSRSNYPLAQEPVEMPQIIAEAIKTTQARGDNDNIKIKCNFSDKLPKVRSGNLFQVFSNLTKNAFDSMPQGGELTISTWLESEKTIIIEFRDTGCGFDPKDEDALFEPFFTTKDKDKGTGLGLSICKDIIERYQGCITAENARETGSVFTIYLPLPFYNLGMTKNE